MIKKAAAVKGDLENNKAKVIASGSGDLASEIVRIAKEYNIAIKQDKDLAEVLAALDVYDNIPDDIYDAVAEILQELYKINKNAYNSNNKSSYTNPKGYVRYLILF